VGGEVEWGVKSGVACDEQVQGAVEQEQREVRMPVHNSHMEERVPPSRGGDLHVQGDRVCEESLDEPACAARSRSGFMVSDAMAASCCWVGQEAVVVDVDGGRWWSKGVVGMDMTTEA
jgi:hypothetical protein